MTDFLWYDFETWGANPRVDRPSQFAAVRTNDQFEPIGEPINLLCKPGPEVVPAPEAVSITGLSPKRLQTEGLNEYEFAQQVQAAMATPNTCTCGYNVIRFDDEVSRHLFYRNFLPIYDREWKNGNSRWDLLDVARLCHALRPQGVRWPKHDNGSPSFRLEDLAHANQLDQEQAHDALSDVYATIGLARLLRQAQPKLFDFALTLSDKNKVKQQISLFQPKPFVHVSGMIPVEKYCLTVMLALAPHPNNANEIICLDLTEDTEMLLAHDPEELRELLFASKQELRGRQRPPIKSIHLNRCPMVAPLSVIREPDYERLHLDQMMLDANIDWAIENLSALRQQALALHEGTPPERHPDAESALYQGFISRSDQQLAESIHLQDLARLAEHAPKFDDQRLQILWDRFLCRNYPQGASEKQLAAYQDFVSRCHDSDQLGSSTTLSDAIDRCEQLLVDEAANEAALHELLDYLKAMKSG